MLKKTNPQEILDLIQLFRFGLISGLISKEEVLKWVERIIDSEDNPDLFFSDLFMMNLKSEKEIALYLSEYLNFEVHILVGKSLFGITYRKLANKKLTLSYIIKTLFKIKDDGIFTDYEIGSIYNLDNNYHMAVDNIHFTIQDIETELIEFLEVYKDYTLENYLDWKKLDERIDSKIT